MKIGAYMKNQHGIEGRVHRIFDDFSAVAACCISMTGEQWLAEQSIPFTKEQLAEPWAELRCDGDTGGVWAPFSCLTPVDDE